MDVEARLKVMAEDVREARRALRVGDRTIAVANLDHIKRSAGELIESLAEVKKVD